MMTSFEAAQRCNCFIGLGSSGCSVLGSLQGVTGRVCGYLGPGLCACLLRDPSWPSFSLPLLSPGALPSLRTCLSAGGITVYPVLLLRAVPGSLFGSFSVSSSCPALPTARSPAPGTCGGPENVQRGLSLSVSSAASLAAHLPDLPSPPAFLFSSLTLSPPMVTVSVSSPGVISPGAVFLGTPVLDRAFFQPRHGPVSWVGRSEAPASSCVTLDGKTSLMGFSLNPLS